MADVASKGAFVPVSAEASSSKEKVSSKQDEKSSSSSSTSPSAASSKGGSTLAAPQPAAEKPSFVVGVLFGAIVMAVGMYVLSNLHHLGPAVRRYRATGSFKSQGRVIVPHGSLQVPGHQTDRYNILSDTWERYEQTLTTFVEQAFPEEAQDFMIEKLQAKAPEVASTYRLPAIPKTIYQTGRDELSDEHNSFKKLNSKATYAFFNDHDLEAWVEENIGGSHLQYIWNQMERVVLKTDLWRYMALLWSGGYYSDLDTDCLKSIDKWGSVDAEVFDLTNQGFDMDEVLASPPQLIVGLEFDVPDYEGWETFWPRPIQVVQWSFASAAGHPVLLDAVRRSVSSIEKIKHWEKDLKEIARERIGELVTEGTTLKRRGIILRELPALMAANPFDVTQGGVMSLVDATGPGAFTDAVFSYLQARWDVHWSQIHDITTTTRIGDVVILPITGFAPFEDANNPRWTGADHGPMAEVGDAHHPQAMVMHKFSGSWRNSGDDAVHHQQQRN